ncbi:MAG: tetratricopeptide repeat protein [Pirellulaceae bacterium]|nr:tetratricopeptide repeat protein [Pirellulaceae bacterium]
MPTPRTPLGEQPAPLTWHARSPDWWGGVAFGSPLRKSQHAAWAMTYLYSPDERATALWVGGPCPLRVWLNGQLVHETRQPDTWAGAQDCVPVVLRAGRNTLCVAAMHEAGPEWFQLRLGDAPWQRAIQCVRLGLWQESLPHWDECCRRYGEESTMIGSACLARLMSGDVAGYAQLSQRALRRATHKMRDVDGINMALRVATLHPDGADKNVDLVRLAEIACRQRPVHEWWMRAPLGMAYYRAGRFAEQVEWLKTSQDVAWVAPRLALGLHGLGQVDEARRRLETADAELQSELSGIGSGPTFRYPADGSAWFDMAATCANRREAAGVIGGDSGPLEKMLDEYAAAGRRELARRTPELAPFDDAVARHGREPRAWRARALRFMQLQRWDEATHDLNQAVALDAHDVRTSIAYAEYWLGRGDATQAADYALRAADGVAANPSDMTRQEWAALLVRFDDDTLAALDPAIQSKLLLARARHHADATDREPPAHVDAWIARGRLHAGLGEHTQGDADFARAASLRGPLSPEGTGQSDVLELNTFLEAGWWVVGPYPAELREFCPPEVDPDPSRPVPTIDPHSGFSDQPSRWVSVPTGSYGLVDVSAVPGSQRGATVYALSYVWAPQPCSTTLMVHRDQALRLWVNQKPIENDLPGDHVRSWHEPFYALPIELHAGRNTILVKIPTASSTFTMRIGDSPRDQIVLLAEQQRFAEAVRAMEDPRLSLADVCHRRAIPELPGRSQVFQPWLPGLWALEDATIGRYESACDELVTEREPSLTRKHHISAVAALRPNSVFREHADLLVSYSEEHLAASPMPGHQAYTALVNFRAGNFQRARELAEPLASWPALLLRTLVEHQAGNASLAEEAFAESLELAEQYADRVATCDRSSASDRDPFASWYDWLVFILALREQEDLLRGQTSASDSVRDRVEQAMSRRWSEAPETAHYDHAIFVAKPHPQPLLARGRRLAELGRFDEALADFDKAVALAPDDWQVQLARAAFLADRGDWEASANVFRPLLAQTGGDRWWLDGRRVEEEIVACEPLLDYLQGVEPNAAIWWRLRGCRLMREQRWGEAATAFTSGDLYWSHFSLAAMLHLLLGDEAAHDRCVQEMERLIDEQLGTNPFKSVHRCFVRTLQVGDEAAARNVLALARESLRENPQSRDARVNLALAYYRAGQHETALRWAQQSLEVPSWWQEHVPAWPVLAMCHWQLGNKDEAQRWLSQTAWWIDFARSVADRPEAIAPYCIDYHLWLRAHLLCQEAQRLIAP